MDDVSKDSTLPEDIKSLSYNDLLQDYKLAMLKTNQSTNPLLNLPVHQNALKTRISSLLPRSTLTRRDLPHLHQEKILFLILHLCKQYPQHRSHQDLKDILYLLQYVT